MEKSHNDSYFKEAVNLFVTGLEVQAKRLRPSSLQAIHENLGIHSQLQSVSKTFKTPFGYVNMFKWPFPISFIKIKRET